MDDGKVAGFWGIVLPTLISDRAYLWLYTTPALDDHQFVFVRQSQIWIKETLKEFPLIVGHAFAARTKSIRWLKWLGAKFLQPEGRLIPFEIRAHNGIADSGWWGRSRRINVAGQHTGLWRRGKVVSPIGNVWLPSPSRPDQFQH